MKCVRLHQYGGVEQLRVEQIDAPRPGADEVLVEIAGAGVNPVDTKMRSGITASVLPIAFPFVLGGDFAGTIVGVGPGVDEARLGEKVMGMVDVTRGGGYAELMTAPAERAVPVPDGLDLITAASLPVGVMTGYDLVELGLDIKPGDKVAVLGAAGSVGRAAVFAAASQGAVVTALVRTLPVVSIAGATSVVQFADKAAIDAAAPFDHIADAVGGDAAAEISRKLRRGGRLATAVGALLSPPSSNDHFSAVGVVVQPRAEALLRFAKALVSGEVRLPEVRRMPLEDAAEAHRIVVAGGTGGKVVLVPTLDPGTRPAHGIAELRN